MMDASTLRALLVTCDGQGKEAKVAALDALLECVPQWVAVTPKTMPAEEDVVLVHYLFGGKESRIRTAYWQGRSWTTFPGMSRIPTPTHYMPLPAPPVLP